MLLVVVVGVVAHDAFAQFLTPALNVRVQLVPVIPDRELLIVINWNVYRLRAIRLVRRVMELSHVRVLQTLVGSEPFAWIEDKEALDHV